MEEIEVPVEAAMEHIHEAAHHSQSKWIGYVALSSAILAVLAAIAALQAGHHANEAMVTQLKATDQWNYYQAKGIKLSIQEMRVELIGEEKGKEAAEKTRQKIEGYKKDQESILEKAKELEKESEAHFERHQVLAKAVTFFQIAIAVGAIAALTRRKKFWLVSLVFGVLGAYFLISSYLLK